MQELSSLIYFAWLTFSMALHYNTEEMNEEKIRENERVKFIEELNTLTDKTFTATVDFEDGDGLNSQQVRCVMTYSVEQLIKKYSNGSI